jgi:cytoskeletal protein CcmA (bactofilin family)
VIIEGRLEGDIKGTEQVVLRRSSEVYGNISAPRVTLEDGARFRGGIDMQDGGEKVENVSHIAGPRRNEKGSSPADGRGDEAPKGDAAKA